MRPRRAAAACSPPPSSACSRPSACRAGRRTWRDRGRRGRRAEVRAERNAPFGPPARLSWKRESGTSGSPVNVVFRPFGDSSTAPVEPERDRVGELDGQPGQLTHGLVRGRRCRSAAWRAAASRPRRCRRGRCRDTRGRRSARRHARPSCARSGPRIGREQHGDRGLAGLLGALVMTGGPAAWRGARSARAPTAPSMCGSKPSAPQSVGVKLLDLVDRRRRLP